MASTAITSQQTIFEVEASPGSPFEWVAVGNVKSISDLEGGSSSEVDITDLRSTAKEFLSGLADNGSVTMAINYYRGDAGQVILDARRLDGRTTNFRITLPSGPTPKATFAGFVKKFSKSMAVDSPVGSSLELRVTGAVTWAA